MPYIKSLDEINKAVYSCPVGWKTVFYVGDKKELAPINPYNLTLGQVNTHIFEGKLMYDHVINPNTYFNRTE